MRIPMARVDKERDSTAIAILATFHSMVESTQSMAFSSVDIRCEKLKDERTCWRSAWSCLVDHR